MRTGFIQSVVATTTMLITLGGITRGDEPARQKEPHLEFRIVADAAHDRDAAEKAKATDTLDHPPTGYRWVQTNKTAKGSSPKMDEKRLIVADVKWKGNEFAGGTVRLSGINLAGSELTREFNVVSNSENALVLRERPSIYFRSIATFQVEMTSGDAPGAGECIVHESQDQSGRVSRWILVKLDPQNISEKDLSRVYATTDERQGGAIGFRLTRDGGTRFGQLTREHLPEKGSTFKYRVGIILDGRLLTAPIINSEIREAGIIELGQKAAPGEVDRIVRILQHAEK